MSKMNLVSKEEKNDMDLLSGMVMSEYLQSSIYGDTGDVIYQRYVKETMNKLNNQNFKFIEL